MLARNPERGHYPTPENFFSKQDGVDTADITDKYLRQRSLYQSDINDRIIPPVELQRLQDKRGIDPEKYLATVTRLQDYFDRKLGGREGTVRNYNPVLERAAFEQLQTEEEKEQFKFYEIKQIETALRERFHVATSTVIYDIDGNGKLRSRDMPNQAFEDVLTMGIEYYQQVNFRDVPRMEQERVGFLKIQEVFTDPDASLDLKAEVVSGPGLVERTIFQDNFLDRYELLEDQLTGRRIVQMTRFASDLSYEQAEKTITTSKPDYFDGKEGPVDEWLLANPIFEGSSGVLIQRKNALKEETFQKIIQGSSDSIHYLVDRICESMLIPEKVALALNTVLNETDYIWEGLVNIKDRVISITSKVVNRIMPIFRTIEEKVNWFGYQAVRAVAAGCGLSGGFSIGSSIKGLVGSLFGGLTNLFSSGSKEGIGGMCGKCGENTSDNHYHCPQCPAKYADETNKAPEARTKQCSCGFQFGC